MRMIKPKRWTRKRKGQTNAIKIIAAGKECQVLMGKFSEGRMWKYGLRKIMPFLGVETGCENRLHGIGVGLKFTETGRVWTVGLRGPTCLIHSWRSAIFLVKIIEKAEQLDRDILEMCWLLMNTDIRPDYPYISAYIRNIAEMLNPKNPDIAEEEVKKIRNEILHSVPLTPQLEDLIKRISNKGLKVCTDEIKEEIDAGRIELTPFIKKVMETGGEIIFRESLLNFASPV